MVATAAVATAATGMRHEGMGAWGWGDCGSWQQVTAAQANNFMAVLAKYCWNAVNSSCHVEAVCSVDVECRLNIPRDGMPEARLWLAAIICMFTALLTVQHSHGPHVHSWAQHPGIMRLHTPRVGHW